MAEKVEIIIEAEDKASDKIDSITGALGGFKKLAGGALLGAGAVAAGAIGGVAAGAVEFAKAAAESQEVETRMQAQLAALGDSANVTSDDIISLADELSKISGFDDEALIQGQSTLLRFGNLSKEQFETATRAATDLAAMTGMDLTSAFQQVGVALDNPEQGFGRLRRQIGDLTTDQQAAIDAAIKLGDTETAQGIILDALAQKTAGAAEMMGGTLSGQMNKFNTTVGNVKEALGGALLPTIQMLAERLLSFVQSDQFSVWVQKIADWLQNQLPIAIQKASDLWTNTLQPALEKLVPIFVNDILPVLLKLAEFLGVILPPAITLFVGGWELIFNAINFVLQPFKNAVDGIERLTQKFTEFWNRVKEIPWVKLGLDIIDGIVDGIKTAASNLINAAVQAATDAYNAVKRALGISSPSKEGIYLGQMFTSGIAEGMKLNTPKLALATDGAVASMLPSVPPGGYRGGGGGSVIINYSPTISTASPAEFERIVPYIDQAMRRVGRRR